MEAQLILTGPDQQSASAVDRNTRSCLNATFCFNLSQSGDFLKDSSSENPSFDRINVSFCCFCVYMTIIRSK